MEQYRFATLMYTQDSEPGRVNPGRTEQLRRRAQIVQFVWHLPETKRDSDFFIRDSGIVRRE